MFYDEHRFLYVSGMLSFICVMDDFMTFWAISSRMATVDDFDASFLTSRTISCFRIFRKLLQSKRDRIARTQVHVHWIDSMPVNREPQAFLLRLEM
jgi:hypothetical protein